MGLAKWVLFQDTDFPALWLLQPHLLHPHALLGLYLDDGQAAIVAVAHNGSTALCQSKEGMGGCTWLVGSYLIFRCLILFSFATVNFPSNSYLVESMR